MLVLEALASGTFLYGGTSEIVADEFEMSDKECDEHEGTHSKKAQREDRFPKISVVHRLRRRRGHYSFIQFSDRGRAYALNVLREVSNFDYGC